MAITRGRCPDCAKDDRDQANDNLILFDNGSNHCFSCGYHVSSDLEKANGINQKQKEDSKLTDKKEPEAIPHRGIKLPTAAKYGVFRTTSNGIGATVVPLGPHFEKVIRDDKVIWSNGDKTKVVPMGVEYFTDKTLPLVITEGEYDCLSVAGVLGNNYNVTSLVSGSNSVSKFIVSYGDLLSSARQIILFLDNDEPGKKAVSDFIKEWGSSKIRVVTGNPKKDANELLMAQEEGLIESLVKNAAKQYMEGVTCVADMDLSLLDETQPPAIPSNFTALDYYLGGGFRRGELTMVAGGSGLGKSTFCTNLVYNLMLANPTLKIADIKLEKRQVKNIKSYIAMYFNMSYRRICEEPSLVTMAQRNEFKQVFGNLYTNSHFGSLTSHSLLNLLEYYAVDCEVDFIILDHISIAISGTSSSREGERKDIDMLVTKIRELINRTNVSIICVSQLKNPEADGPRSKWEDGKRVSRSHLRGSGSLQHLADNIISVEGDLYGEAKEERLVRLIKSREGDEQEVECDIFTLDRITQKAALKIRGL